MAEPYLEYLSQIIEGLKDSRTDGVRLETKHFFSGAAGYANGKIFASLSPSGFALKLPDELRQSLIDEGKGSEFRFFDQGPIKKEYVALPGSTVSDERKLEDLLMVGISYALGEAGSSAA